MKPLSLYVTTVFAGCAYLLLAPDVNAFVLKKTKVIGSLMLDQEYNDNMLYAKANPEDDFITTIAPRVRLENKNERLDLGLEGGLQHAAYVSHRELNDTDYDFGGRAAYQISELSSAEVSASFKKDSRVDRDLETSGLILDLTSRRTYESSVSCTTVLDEKTHLQASYTLSGENYAGQNVEYTYHKGSLTVVRNLNGLTTETMGWGTVFAGYYDYESAAVLQLVAQGGFEKRVNETWTLNGAFGPRMTRTDYAQPFIASQTDIGVTGNLTFSFNGEKDRFTSSLAHELTPSSGRSGTVQRTTISAAYRHRLTQDLSWRLEGRYIRNRSQADEGMGLNISENHYRFLPSLDYTINNNLRLRLQYDYLRITDNKGQGAVDRNQMVVSLTGQFDDMGEWFRDSLNGY